MKRYGRPPRTDAGRRGVLGTGFFRDLPAAHEALAAELDFRDDVSSATATASGVQVEMVGDDELPYWIREKASQIGVALDLRGGGEPLPGHRELRHRRIRAGLNQADVADRLDVHQSTVSGWECGDKRLRPARAAQYARVVGGAP